MFRYAEHDKKKVQDNSKPRRGLSPQQASRLPAVPAEQPEGKGGQADAGGVLRCARRNSREGGEFRSNAQVVFWRRGFF